MIRQLQPLDLALVVPLCRRVGNEARVKEKMDGQSLCLSSLIGSLLPAKKELSLISLDGSRVSVLVSLRRRSGVASWEVANLLLGSGGEEVFGETFEKLNAPASRLGIQKVFLRILEGSRAESPARQAGFAAYSAEALYAVSPSMLRNGAGGPETGLSSRIPALKETYDGYRFFTLNAPSEIVRAEGVTFDEWRESRERAIGSGGNTLVIEDKGEPLACVRWFKRRDSVQLEMVCANAGPEKMLGAVRLLLRSFGRYRRVSFLVSSYQTGLQTAVMDSGCSRGREYRLLVKQLALRVQAPGLAAARA